MAVESPEVIFREEQDLGGWAWLIGAVIIMTNIVVPALALLRQAMQPRSRWPWRRRPEPSVPTPPSAAPGMLMGVLVTALVFKLRLVTEVRHDGLHYRLAPFFRRAHHIPFDEMVTVEAVRFNPLRDYGGWGLRPGFGRRGTAYTVRGNRGVLITTRDGKRRLIGSQRPEQLAGILLQGVTAPGAAAAA